MKFFNLFFTSLLIFSIISCTNTQKNPIEGTWECVSSEYISPEDTTQNQNSEFRRYKKFITKTHFAFIDQDTSINNAVFAGGKYTFDGETYTETFEFFTNPKFIGKRVTYKSKITENKWEISGTLHLQEWGIGEFDYKIVEVWKKID